MKLAKQILVIRKDLNMRKGKIASQAAHASMKVLLDRMLLLPFSGNGPTSRVRRMEYDANSALAFWIDGIFTKICVSVNSEKELLDLQVKAEAAGLPHALIQDVGKTEFGGVPTYTALAIGPAWTEELDPLTSHLPLL